MLDVSGKTSLSLTAQNLRDITEYTYSDAHVRLISLVESILICSKA